MWILFWLMVKHFICDFPLQAFPWQYTNKGTYGHPGGLTHAGIHLLGTSIVSSFYIPWYWAIGWGCFDAVYHYHIDWAKMNIGKRYNLKPNNSELFWILLGFDQFLHFITYFYIAWKITN